MGGVIFQIYYGLIELKLFIILTKYISLERSESQDSIFGGYFVIVASTVAKGWNISGKFPKFTGKFPTFCNPSSNTERETFIHL